MTITTDFFFKKSRSHVKPLSTIQKPKMCLSVTVMQGLSMLEAPALLFPGHLKSPGITMGDLGTTRTYMYCCTNGSY